MTKTCPNCQETVVEDTLACKACGYDFQYAEASFLDDPQLPTGYSKEEEFVYDDFLKKEGLATEKKSKANLVALIIGLALLGLVLLAITK